MEDLGILGNLFSVNHSFSSKPWIVNDSTRTEDNSLKDIQEIVTFYLTYSTMYIKCFPITLYPRLTNKDRNSVDFRSIIGKTIQRVKQCQTNLVIAPIFYYIEITTNNNEVYYLNHAVIL